MHILFASTDFIENNGPTTGLPKYLYRTSKKLIEWGHNVTVVTCSNRTVQYEFCGINVHRVRMYNIKVYENQYSAEMARCLRNAQIIHDEIAKIVLEEKIDIIQYTNLSGISYYHDFNIPSVVRLSSYAKMWPLRGMEEVSRARSQIELAAASKCNAVFAPSNIVAKKFAEDLGENVSVIETPYVFEADSVDNSVYEENLKDKQYILYYGSFVEYKGMGTIASSIFDILHRNENLFFCLIGDGDKEWKNIILQKAGQYAERVIFIAAIGFNKLVTIIKHAELVVLPSLMENFSNACVEAMALGQIVLGTNGSSFEQLINDGENGFLCEIGDKESFIDKVNEAITISESKKNFIKKNAINRAEQLKPEKVTKELLEYYFRVIIAFEDQR